MATKWVEPFPTNKRGDEFGNLAAYRKGRPHRGLDWSVPAGSLIKAIASGAIKQVEWSDGLGWFVIQSADGGKKFVIYAHLQEKPKLTVGKYVYAGKTAVGRVGSTGDFSTGAHLHLSVATVEDVHLCAYDKLIDPAKLFDSEA
jgi:murein DD-endopeptidase MepM/ murein hydrolase activator NlpD